MKKLLSYILVFILTITTLIEGFDTSVYAAKSKTTWPTAPKLYGKTAVLIDASTGTILYDKKCHKKMYPASITKIMTALLTIENCSLDETVKYSKNAVESLHFDDAKISCQVGEKMTVKDCLYALMLHSANEVATALGEHVAGSIDKFADMMNERAKQAGATDTHFANANGLHDEKHYVTAYDMAMIMRDAIQYPLFNEIINTVSYKIPKNNKRKEPLTVYQRHKMVLPASGFYYEGIIGGKTGFTDQSGTTLVTCARRNGMTLISVVLKSNGYNVYKDTKKLLDYGFDNFNLLKVADNETGFSDDSTAARKSPFCDTANSVSIDADSCVIIPKKAKFTQLSKKVAFGLAEDSFATITYSYGDTTVGTAKLTYNSVSYNTSEDVTTNADKTTALEETTTAQSRKTTRPFKIPKAALPIGIAIAIIAVIIVIIKMQQRRLNKIRSMKRQRKR